MRIAGIHIDGRQVWADAGDRQVALLDDVTVMVDGTELSGFVVVTPEQMLTNRATGGVITEVRRHPPPDPACADLPGADLPPLGSQVVLGGVRGMVVALDVPERMVTVRIGEEERQISLDDLTSNQPPRT